MTPTLLESGAYSRPFIVTFYSFKGGVGRTLTLVNVAFSLAARGKTVLLIDFDLEAPGLDAFPTLSPQSPTPGLLEYTEEYLQTGTPTDLQRFVRKVHEAPGEGSVYIMYAGRFDETYPERLGRINWNEFYARHDGYYFFENLKDELRERYSPDYILIDSRTGQADVAGVATVHLPDTVVLMYALDEQNIRGAARMAEAIRNNPIKKSIKVIPVASRVPAAADYRSLQQSRLAEAQRKGIEPSLVLPFEPSLVFGESVLTRINAKSQISRPLSPLVGKVGELTDEVIRSNAEDPDNLLAQARSAFAHGNRERVWELSSGLVTKAGRVSSRTWLEFGTLLMGTGRYDEAVQALNFAKELSPGWSEPLIKLAQVAISSPSRNLVEAMSYAKQYIEKGGQEFGQVFNLAHGLFRAADLTAAEQLLRWCDKADSIPVKILARTDLELILIAENRLSEALELFEDSFKLDPKLKQNTMWLYNYAEALRRMGRPEAVEVFQQSLSVAASAEQFLVHMMTSSDLGHMLAASDQANFAQALGHALAVLGEKGRARTFLEWAMQLARRIGHGGLIFSTVSYKWEKPAAFLQHTRVLLEEDVGVKVEGIEGLMMFS